MGVIQRTRGSHELVLNCFRCNYVHVTQMQRVTLACMSAGDANKFGILSASVIVLRTGNVMPGPATGAYSAPRHLSCIAWAAASQQDRESKAR